MKNTLLIIAIITSMAFNVFLFSRNSEMNETNQRLNDDIDFAIKQMNDKADE